MAGSRARRRADDGGRFRRRRIPEAIVQAVYETINRAPSENFDWDRLRTLFLPTAFPKGALA